jgi:NTE family protein
MKLFGLAAIFVLTFGCTGQRTLDPSEKNGSFSTQGPTISEPGVATEAIPELYGPETPLAEGPSQVSEAMGPPPAGTADSSATGADPQLSVGKTCVLLGPGLARGVAHAGVLEAIRKAGIPIHCIVGTEMGSLVGALFSHGNGSPNSVQWNLFKLGKDIYFDFPLLALREPRAKGNRLHEFLQKVFAGASVERLPIPFATIAIEAETNDPIIIRSGDLASAISASVAIPGIFEPWPREGRQLISASLVSPAALEAAKEMGASFLLLVDVLEEFSPKEAGNRFGKAFMPIRSLMKMQKREAQAVINVKVGSVPLDDFSKRGEAINAGRQAAERVLPEIKLKWEASLVR